MLDKRHFEGSFAHSKVDEYEDLYDDEEDEEYN